MNFFKNNKTFLYFERNSFKTSKYKNTENKLMSLLLIDS